MSYDGITRYVQHTTGMNYIAYLIKHPDHEFTALELERVVDRTPPPDDHEQRATEAEAADAGLAILETEAQNDVMDSEYRRDMQRLIREFDDAIERAESLGATERVAELKAQQQHYFEVLSAAVGKGGRVRKHRDRAARTHDRISRSIRRALKRIEQRHQSFHAHLNVALVRSTFFSYKPDRHIDWLTE